MRYLFVSILLTIWLPGFAQQTNSQNYVISQTYKQSGSNPNDVSKVVTQVQYIDGLGRPMQNVVVGQSPAGSDIVTHIEYDAYGRQAKQFLPFTAAGNGAFQANGASATTTWYNANSANLKSNDLGHPFTETVFEPSPLNRPSSVRAPGNNSASSSIQYTGNIANEVKLYIHNGSTIVQNGFYAAGTLYRSQITDENSKVSNEYTDLQGRVVCKSIAESGGLATYYVYDDYRLLRAVLQPNYQDDASLTNSAFLYDYDNRGRLIKKQIPGAGNMEMVYDNFDRLVYARDANQATRGVWGFTKYDGFNRPIATGEISSAADRATLASTVDTAVEHHETRDNGATAGYSLGKTAPKTATEADLRTITFYDDYGFLKPTGFDYTNGYGIVNTSVKGQVTGGRVRMLPGNGGTGAWLTAVTYYDGEYRAIQSVRDLYDLGVNAKERTSMQYKYDLAPVVSQQKTVQTVNGSDKIHIQTFEYDHADRLLSVTETVQVGAKIKTAITLAQRYNTLGQLQSKWFHAYATAPTKFRTRTDYTNNIRGWLTNAQTKYQIHTGTDLPFYTIGLEYANGVNYTNGNISSMKWAEKDVSTITKGLSFSYDGANRLISSTGIGGYGDTESGITFDKNGNIKTLQRAGAAVDNLGYSYVGNRLSAVNDGSGNNTGVKSGASAYAYDANGNMTSDGNRGAVLTYNYLNLPKLVSIGGKTFAYDYDAGGTKHKYYDSNYNPPTGDTLYVKYAGTFEYDASNVLKRVATSEGQLVPSGDTLRFDYFIKDHLGNVRVVFNEKGDVLQQTDYYPFGLEIDRNSPVISLAGRNNLNRRLYLGKELQVGTGYLDLSRRFFDPLTGRFTNIDPVTDTQENYSTYQYGWNNPILRSDPNGDIPNGGDDPFLIARLVTTAFFDTKHAIINTTARAFGSDIRAGYKVEDGQQVFETQISRQSVENSISGQLKEAVNSIADVALVATAGSSPANPGNLLSKTSETQVVRVLKETTATRAGMPFTRRGRTEVLNANAVKNQGKIICEGCGVKTTKPEKSSRGVTPPKTDYQIDHVFPKVKGGSGVPENGQVLCRDCNVKKSDN